MEKWIDFNVIGIAEAIKQKQLIVPTNQREYSWEEEQVSSLLQDISNALRSPEKPYFLGTIVLTNSTSSDKREVADGQQRLATTTMIMAAFRNWYRMKGQKEMVNAIESDFLFTYDWATEERIHSVKVQIKSIVANFQLIFFRIFFDLYLQKQTPFGGRGFEKTGDDFGFLPILSLQRVGGSSYTSHPALFFFTIAHLLHCLQGAI